MAAIMSKVWLQEQCKKYKQYHSPHLNDKLYLQNQGFSAIENLEEYTVRSFSWILKTQYDYRQF